jgi:hypothetical protein
VMRIHNTDSNIGMIRIRIQNSRQIHLNKNTRYRYLGVSQRTSAGGLPVTEQSRSISEPTIASVSLDISWTGNFFIRFWVLCRYLHRVDRELSLFPSRRN